jgi:UDP-N-acetylmuramyl pentapeptide synthase
VPLTWTAVLEELRGADLLDSAPATASDPTGIGVDSRMIERGMLYIAVRGSQADGHQFVSQAVSRGAGAIVVEFGARARRRVVRPPGSMPDTGRRYRDQWKDHYDRAHPPSVQ